MKDYHGAAIISIAVHAAVISLLVTASPMVRTKQAEILEVDLAVLQEPSGEGALPEVTKQRIHGKPQPAGSETAAETRSRPHPALTETGGNARQDKQAEQHQTRTDVIVSDTRSAVVVGGAAGDGAGSASAHASGAYGGPGEGIQGSGRGRGVGEGKGDAPDGQGAGVGPATGGSDYRYIRDAIMQNVHYPDEAIRLGIEGKVLVSFIVLENGRTSEVKIVGSSGSLLLDRSAKEAVATTRIGRKVPYRVVVHLPITYKLKGSRG